MLWTGPHAPPPPTTCRRRRRVAAPSARAERVAVGPWPQVSSGLYTFIQPGRPKWMNTNDDCGGWRQSTTS